MDVIDESTGAQDKQTRGQKLLPSERQELLAEYGREDARALEGPVVRGQFVEGAQNCPEDQAVYRNLGL